MRIFVDLWLARLAREQGLWDENTMVEVRPIPEERTMSDDAILVMIDFIKELVHEPSLTWSEKRKRVKSLCNEDELVALAEFASWFEAEDD